MYQIIKALTDRIQTSILNYVNGHALFSVKIQLLSNIISHLYPGALEDDDSLQMQPVKNITISSIQVLFKSTMQKRL